jgi:hypothetical protein
MQRASFLQTNSPRAKPSTPYLSRKLWLGSWWFSGRGPLYCIIPGLVSAFEQGLGHTKESVQEFLAAKGVKTILHPSYLLDLAPKVKLELAGWPLTVPGSFRMSWEGVIGIITEDSFCFLKVDGAL